MQEPKYTPVLTVRLLQSGTIITIGGKAQVALDPSVPRDLMLAILRHVAKVLEAGRSPAEIAALKF